MDENQLGKARMQGQLGPCRGTKKIPHGGGMGEKDLSER